MERSCVGRARPGRSPAMGRLILYGRARSGDGVSDEARDEERTLRLIGLYQAGVGAVVFRLREVAGTPNLAAAVSDGRLARRGKLLRAYRYRVCSDHLIVTFPKLRIEFSLKRPEAFSAYLLQRHIDQNRLLMRMWPQFNGLPLADHLHRLSERQLVKRVDDTADLFELTPEGQWRESELRRTDDREQSLD